VVAGAGGVPDVAGDGGVPDVAGDGGVVGGGARVAAAGGVVVSGARVVAGAVGVPAGTTALGATTTLGIVTGVPGTGCSGDGADGGTTVSLTGACGCVELALVPLTSCSRADVSVTPPASGGGRVESLGPGAVDSPSIGPTTCGCAGWRAQALAATTTSIHRRAEQVIPMHGASRVPAMRPMLFACPFAMGLRDRDATVLHDGAARSSRAPVPRAQLVRRSQSRQPCLRAPSTVPR
jgi:hypothetical protein